MTSIASIFGLFGQGLTVGLILSGIPWAVGYLIRSVRKIFLAG